MKLKTQEKDWVDYNSKLEQVIYETKSFDNRNIQNHMKINMKKCDSGEMDENMNIGISKTVHVKHL